MRFAFTGCDRTLGIFDAFVKAGWEPVKLFVAPARGPIDATRAMVDRAAKLKLEIQVSRMTDRSLQQLSATGCDALVVATYDWRIGDWRPFLKYAVNFHPSPLPVGRGPYPTVRAILEGRSTWGTTCHKLEPEFDSGDVLAQETFPMSGDECQESLELKLQLAGIHLTERVASEFVALWDTAARQGEGSYWKKWTEKEQTIDFSQPVESIMRHIRAFGLIESIARFGGSPLVAGPIHVRRAAGWTEKHSHVPGRVVHVDASSRAIVVAAPDGYVALIEWALKRT